MFCLLLPAFSAVHGLAAVIPYSWAESLSTFNDDTYVSLSVISQVKSLTTLSNDADEMSKPFSNSDRVELMLQGSFRTT